MNWVRFCWAAGMLVWYFLFLRKANWLPKGYPAELAFTAMAGGFVLSFRYESAQALLAACAAALLWMWIRKQLPNWLRIGDSAFWAFPFAWIPVRLGCVIEHRHFGRLSDSWLAVRYPDGSRWDLALLEMLWAVVAAALVWKSKYPAAVVLLTLGLFRILIWPLQAYPEPDELWFPVLLVAWGAVAFFVGRGRRVSEP